MTIDPSARVRDHGESKLASRPAAVPPDADVSPPSGQAASDDRVLIPELSERLRQMQDDLPSVCMNWQSQSCESRYTISPEQIARSILANMILGS